MRERSEAGLSDAVAEAAGVSNVRGWRGGNWGGSIDYVTFDCASLDGCRAAVRALMEVDCHGDRELAPFGGVVPTRFAVNLDGPAFYFPEEIPAPWWDVSAVRRGEWYEWNRGDDRMDFYLIDPARDRVFHHHESGGFPADPPAPTGSAGAFVPAATGAGDTPAPSRHARPPAS